MKQKILSIFLILCMVLGMLPAGALAVETGEGSSVTVGGRSVEQSSAATEITINDGTETYYAIPQSNDYAYSVSQYVMPAADLAAISGKVITDLTYYGTSHVHSSRTLDIYFQEADSFDLSSTFVQVDQDGKVFAGTATFDGGILYVELSTPYAYGGKDLLVTVIDSTGEDKTRNEFAGTSGGVSRYSNSLSSAFDVANLVGGITRDFVPKTTIGFREASIHHITVEESENGTVTAPETAYGGIRVRPIITPAEGYALESLTVTQGETEIEVDNDGSFIMPTGDVVIRAVFFEKISYVINDGASSNENVPLNNYFDYSVAQYVIPAADLVQLFGKGIVDLTYFYTAQSNADNDRTLAIYFQEGENFDLESGFVPVDENGLVFSGVASLKDGQLYINLDEVYVYGGQDLLVTLIDSTGSYITTTYFFGTEGGSSRYHKRDGDSYDAQNLQVPGTHSTFVPKTQIGVINVEAHSITVSETANGTVSAPEEAPQGVRIPLTITPDEGCLLKSLTVMQGETVIEVSDDFTFIMPAGDVTISATFKQPERYDIAVEGAANGTVTAPESAYESHTVTLTVTPDAGYALESLTVMQGQTAVEVTRVDKTTCTFIMPAGDVVICATFAVPSEVVLYDGTAVRDYVPLNNYYKYSVAQYVIPAADLAVMQGQWLYHLAYFSDHTGTMDRTITVYLMEGDNLDVSDEFIQLAGATQVFSGPVSLANGKLEINFDEFFFYTGQDLLVTVVDSTGRYESSADFYGVETDFESVRAICRDSASYDPMNLTGGSSYKFLPKMEILCTAIANNITVEETANGTVTAPKVYYAGGTVTIKVTPDAGCVLESLTVMQGETEIEVGDDFTFIMPEGDVTITAVFSPLPEYNITVETENGTVIVPESFYETGTVTLTITPDAGYALESLTVMQGETAVEVTWVDDTTCTFTMPAGDVTVIVYFDPLPEWSITVEEMANGTVTAPESFYEGQTVTLTVAPEEGYVLKSLTVMQGETAVEVTRVDDTTCTFTMPAGDVTVSAVFAVAEQLKVSLEDSYGDGWNGNKLNIYMETEGGTEVLLYGDLTINTGRNAEYTLLVPADATLCVRWVKGLYAYECSFTITRSGMTVHVQEKGSLTTETETGELLARIEPLAWRDITVEVTGNGTVLVPQQGAVGHTVQLTPIPDEGYVLYDLVVMSDGVSIAVDNDYCFVMPDGEVTVIAEFQVPQIYSITVEDNEYVSVEVQSSALAGSEVTLTVRPKVGYHQDGLAAMCKGRDLLLTDHWNGTYSFIMPSGDVTVTVDYVEDGHVSDHQEDGYRLIWYSGFETIESMLGLLNWDINGYDEYNWKWWENGGSSVGHEAQFMGSDSSNDLTTDNWLILPEMSLQEGRDYLFTLMAQTYDDDEEELFAVYVTTDGGQTLVQLGEKQYAPEELTKFAFDLSDYAGQTIQLVVSHEDTNDIGVLVVDCLCVYQELLTKTYYFDVIGNMIPEEADFFGPNGETSYGHPVTPVEGNIYSVCVPEGVITVMLVDAAGNILTDAGIALPTDGKNLFVEAEHAWYIYGAEDCDHQGETTWIDNGDGTHSEICDLCDTVLTEKLGHGEKVTYTNDGDTHSATYDCCGETFVSNEAHTYMNGECVCGAVEVVEKQYTIKVAGKSLLLEGMISINAKCAFLNADGTSVDEAYILANGGIEFVGVNGEILVVTELVRSSKHPDGYYTYAAESMGIPAKDMGTTLVMRPFLVVDGEKIYGEETTYGVLDYVANMMKKSSTSVELKSTLVGLLNYGAAAQEYFDSVGTYEKPEVLMNACLQEYVAAGYIDASVLDLNWNGDLLNPIVEPAEFMTVNFTKNGVVAANNKIGKSLLLEGAVMINYKVVVGSSNNNFQNATSTLYCWTSAQYAELLANGEAFTKENARYQIEGEGIVYDRSAGYMVVINSEAIAAKELGETLYVAMVIVDDNGDEHCTGVITYSPEQYAKNQIDKNQKAYLVQMCKWMVTYGERARINFSK